jgi:membrane protein implicated in regulation of membrane protease activity
MKAAPFFHKNVATSKHKVWERKRALGKLKFKRFCWLFWLAVFILVFPIASLVLPPVTDAVPASLGPSSWIGWVLRFLALILYAIAFLLVWKHFVEPIAKKQGELDKANEKLAEDRDQLKKAENGWRTQ